jgi:hypothetical protein
VHDAALLVTITLLLGAVLTPLQQCEAPRDEYTREGASGTDQGW